MICRLTIPDHLLAQIKADRHPDPLIFLEVLLEDAIRGAGYNVPEPGVLITNEGE